MSAYYYPYYSLRDEYQMGSSGKKHRSRRSHRKLKPQYYQSNVDSSDRPYLTNLPPEIQLSIFETLDPVSSTCLGLSSRRLYPLHRSAHKKVGLFEQSNHHPLPLCLLLKDWAPSDMVLDWESEKLVSRERYDKLQADREREGRDFTSYIPGHRRHLRSSRDYKQSKYYEHRKDEENPRLRRRRPFEAVYYPTDVENYASSYHYQPFSTAQESVRPPKLRRRRRFEKHDIWSFGRRIRFW